MGLKHEIPKPVGDPKFSQSKEEKLAAAQEAKASE